MEHKPHHIEELSHQIQKIRTGILAFVLSLFGGLGLFMMTFWLLLKGGIDIGKHLQLLRHYFPGYSVTWSGCFVGLFYGALLGAIVGWLIGSIYNRIVDMYPSTREG
ncbi:hypothetical protein CSA56_17350 [candidate division KSB3 bacterium]|uniref:Uncharacterized protein n=1 Tax=candidate division KSB3 bacterium TaxID=2044937 RepID=A0A2G6K808_9BACT|nr:MAG: hypothetical protein CSA56_17350 [candidate division KSB3 bacterium]